MPDTESFHKRQECEDKLKKADRTPAAWQVYRHFRGNLYQVLTLARKEDTGEQLVIYQALYPPYQTYARSLESFTSEVDHEKYPDAQQRYRFELVAGRDENQQNVPSDMEGTGSEADGTDENPQDESTGQEAAEADDTSDRILPADNTAKLIEEFLDCDSAAERMELLRSMRPQLTDRMVDTMAMGAGFDVAQGPLDARIDDLMNCLQTVARFETDRSRFRP